MEKQARRKPPEWPKRALGEREHARHHGARFCVREQLKIVLLLIPVMFWSGIFLALAGVGLLERFIESTPDAAQALVALGCPLLAVILGVEAAGEARRAGGGRARVACWATVAAGVALFVFAALVSLKQS